MEHLLPSEIARLVYGYLEAEKCNEAAVSFLKTSRHLQECYQYYLQNGRFSSKVMGFTLLECLDLLCAVHRIVQNHISLLENDALEKYSLTEQLNFLLDSRDFKTSNQVGKKTNKKTDGLSKTNVSNSKPPDILDKCSPSDSSAIFTPFPLSVDDDTDPVFLVPETTSSESLPGSKKSRRKTPLETVSEEFWPDNGAVNGSSVNVALFKKPFLDKPELQSKIVDNINKALNTPEKSGSGSKDKGKSAGEQLDSVIKTVVNQLVDEDPLFDDVLAEIIEKLDFSTNPSPSLPVKETSKTKDVPKPVSVPTVEVPHADVLSASDYEPAPQDNHDQHNSSCSNTICDPCNAAAKGDVSANFIIDDSIRSLSEAIKAEGISAKPPDNCLETMASNARLASQQVSTSQIVLPNNRLETMANNAILAPQQVSTSQIVLPNVKKAISPTKRTSPQTLESSSIIVVSNPVTNIDPVKQQSVVVQQQYFTIVPTRTDAFPNPVQMRCPLETHGQNYMQNIIFAEENPNRMQSTIATRKEMNKITITKMQKRHEFVNIAPKSEANTSSNFMVQAPALPSACIQYPSIPTLANRSMMPQSKAVKKKKKKSQEPLIVEVRILDSAKKDSDNSVETGPLESSKFSAAESYRQLVEAMTIHPETPEKLICNRLVTPAKIDNNVQATPECTVNSPTGSPEKVSVTPAKIDNNVQATPESTVNSPTGSPEKVCENHSITPESAATAQIAMPDKISDDLTITFEKVSPEKISKNEMASPERIAKNQIEPEKTFQNQTVPLKEVSENETVSPEKESEYRTALPEKTCNRQTILGEKTPKNKTVQPEKVVSNQIVLPERLSYNKAVPPEKLPDSHTTALEEPFNSLVPEKILDSQTTACEKPFNSQVPEKVPDSQTTAIEGPSSSQVPEKISSNQTSSDFGSGITAVESSFVDKNTVLSKTEAVASSSKDAGQFFSTLELENKLNRIHDSEKKAKNVPLISDIMLSEASHSASIASNNCQEKVVSYLGFSFNEGNMTRESLSRMESIHFPTKCDTSISPLRGPSNQRQSLSTPRRKKSHVRALDFSTPPNFKDRFKRRANTSPKVAQAFSEAVSERVKSVRRSELFQSPIAETLEKTTAEEQWHFASVTKVTSNNETKVTSNNENLCPAGLKTPRESRIRSITSPLSCIKEDSPMKCEEIIPDTLTERQKLPIATRLPLPKLSGGWDKVNGVGLIFGSPKHQLTPSKSFDEESNSQLSVCSKSPKIKDDLKSWDFKLRAMLHGDYEEPEPAKKNVEAKSVTKKSETSPESVRSLTPKSKLNRPKKLGRKRKSERKSPNSKKRASNADSGSQISPVGFPPNESPLKVDFSPEVFVETPAKSPVTIQTVSVFNVPELTPNRPEATVRESDVKTTSKNTSNDKIVETMQKSLAAISDSDESLPDSFVKPKTRKEKLKIYSRQTVVEPSNTVAVRSSRRIQLRKTNKEASKSVKSSPEETPRKKRNKTEEMPRKKRKIAEEMLRKASEKTEEILPNKLVKTDELLRNKRGKTEEILSKKLENIEEVLRSSPEKTEEILSIKSEQTEEILRKQAKQLTPGKRPRGRPKKNIPPPTLNSKKDAKNNAEFSGSFVIKSKKSRKVCVRGGEAISTPTITKRSCKAAPKKILAVQESTDDEISEVIPSKSKFICTVADVHHDPAEYEGSRNMGDTSFSSESVSEILDEPSPSRNFENVEVAPSDNVGKCHISEINLSDQQSEKCVEIISNHESEENVQVEKSVITDIKKSEIAEVTNITKCLTVENERKTNIVMSDEDSDSSDNSENVKVTSSDGIGKCHNSVESSCSDQQSEKSIEVEKSTNTDAKKSIITEFAKITECTTVKNERESNIIVIDEDSDSWDNSKMTIVEKIDNAVMVTDKKTDNAGDSFEIIHEIVRESPSAGVKDETSSISSCKTNTAPFTTDQEISHRNTPISELPALILSQAWSRVSASSKTKDSGFMLFPASNNLKANASSDCQITENSDLYGNSSVNKDKGATSCVRSIDQEKDASARQSCVIDTTASVGHESKLESTKLKTETNSNSKQIPEEQCRLIISDKPNSDSQLEILKAMHPLELSESKESLHLKPNPNELDLKHGFGKKQEEILNNSVEPQSEVNMLQSVSPSSGKKIIQNVGRTEENIICTANQSLQNIIFTSYDENFLPKTRNVDHEANNIFLKNYALSVEYETDSGVVSVVKNAISDEFILLDIPSKIPDKPQEVVVQNKETNVKGKINDSKTSVQSKETDVSSCESSLLDETILTIALDYAKTTKTHTNPVNKASESSVSEEERLRNECKSDLERILSAQRRATICISQDLKCNQQGTQPLSQTSTVSSEKPIKTSARDMTSSCLGINKDKNSLKSYVASPQGKNSSRNDTGKLSDKQEVLSKNTMKQKLDQNLVKSLNDTKALLDSGVVSVAKNAISDEFILLDIPSKIPDKPQEVVVKNKETNVKGKINDSKTSVQSKEINVSACESSLFDEAILTSALDYANTTNTHTNSLNKASESSVSEEERLRNESKSVLERILSAQRKSTIGISPDLKCNQQGTQPLSQTSTVSSEKPIKKSLRDMTSSCFGINKDKDTLKSYVASPQGKNSTRNNTGKLSDKQEVLSKNTMKQKLDPNLVKSSSDTKALLSGEDVNMQEGSIISLPCFLDRKHKSPNSGPQNKSLEKIKATERMLSNSSKKLVSSVTQSSKKQEGRFPPIKNVRSQDERLIQKEETNPSIISLSPEVRQYKSRKTNQDGKNYSRKSLLSKDMHLRDKNQVAGVERGDNSGRSPSPEVLSSWAQHQLLSGEEKRDYSRKSLLAKDKYSKDRNQRLSGERGNHFGRLPSPQLVSSQNKNQPPNADKRDKSRESFYSEDKRSRSRSRKRSEERVDHTVRSPSPEARYSRDENQLQSGEKRTQSHGSVHSGDERSRSKSQKRSKERVDHTGRLPSPEARYSRNENQLQSGEKRTQSYGSVYSGDKRSRSKSQKRSKERVDHTGRLPSPQLVSSQNKNQPPNADKRDKSRESFYSEDKRSRSRSRKRSEERVDHTGRLPSPEARYSRNENQLQSGEKRTQSYGSVYSGDKRSQSKSQKRSKERVDHTGRLPSPEARYSRDENQLQSGEKRTQSHGSVYSGDKRSRSNERVDHTGRSPSPEARYSRDENQLQSGEKRTQSYGSVYSGDKRSRSKSQKRSKEEVDYTGRSPSPKARYSRDENQLQSGEKRTQSYKLKKPSLNERMYDRKPWSKNQYSHDKNLKRLNEDRGNWHSKQTSSSHFNEENNFGYTSHRRRYNSPDTSPQDRHRTPHHDGKRKRDSNQFEEIPISKSPVPSAIGNKLEMLHFLEENDVCWEDVWKLKQAKLSKLSKEDPRRSGTAEHDSKSVTVGHKSSLAVQDLEDGEISTDNSSLNHGVEADRISTPDDHDVETEQHLSKKRKIEDLSDENTSTSILEKKAEKLKKVDIHEFLSKIHPSEKE